MGDSNLPPSGPKSALETNKKKCLLKTMLMPTSSQWAQNKGDGRKGHSGLVVSVVPGMGNRP